MRASSRRRLPRRRRRRLIARKAHRLARRVTSRRATRQASPHAPSAITLVALPIDPQLQEGIDLFNHHQFFECHEVLEQRWREITDASKDFYKGLIQAAVAFYHWSRGNLPGALTLARSSSGYLKRYGPVWYGIDVDGFRTQLSELFQWLRRHRQRYDPHLVPPIRKASCSNLS